MKKQFSIILMVAIMSISMVMALDDSVDIVPDCGPGWQWGNICHEDDLMDEFSEISSELTEGIRHDMEQDEAIEYDREVIIQSLDIGMSNSYYLEIEVTDREALEPYINSNSNTWSKDEVGGGVGHNTLTKTLEAFVYQLRSLFAPKSTEDRVYILEQKIKYLEESGRVIFPNSIYSDAAEQKAKDYNVTYAKVVGVDGHYGTWQVVKSE